MMTPKNSDIVARYRNLGGTKERTFLFTILNSGNRTGEVGNVTLQARIDGCFDVPLRLYSDPAVEFVQPGEMKRLILYVLDSPIGIKEKIQQCAGKKLECTITINGNDFTGENKVLNPSDMIIPGNDCEEVIQSRIQKS